MRLAMRIGFAAFLCWFVLASTPVRGDEPAKSEGRKVVANASATVYVEPDGARLTFFVISNASPDRNARDLNEKQVKKLREALAAIPLDKREVEVRVLPSTISSTVNANDPGGARTLTGKRVQSVVQVTVYEKDLTKLREAVSQLAETIVENGGTGIDNDSLPYRMIRAPRAIARDEQEPAAGPSIEWLATEQTRARRDAIRRATRQAMADAEAAAGVSTLKVLEIQVTSNDEAILDQRLIGTVSARGVSSQTQIPVRVQVHVTCGF
jgi:uncharacterized protein YggE